MIGLQRLLELVFGGHLCLLVLTQQLERDDTAISLQTRRSLLQQVVATRGDCQRVNATFGC